jgi:predicted site-specific integrase-resolvase
MAKTVQEYSWYTSAETGRILRVKPLTLRRWIRTGLIPKSCFARTLGGHLRFDKDYIDGIASGRITVDYNPEKFLTVVGKNG